MKKIILLSIMSLCLVGSPVFANGAVGWHGNNGWHAGWNRAPDWHYGNGNIAYGAPYYYGDFQYDYVPGRTPNMSEYENYNTGPMLYDSENSMYFDFTQF